MDLGNSDLWGEMVRLTKEDKAFRYSGRYIKYLIAYDYASCRNNVYTGLILTENEPIIIARECDLKNYQKVNSDI